MVSARTGLVELGPVWVCILVVMNGTGNVCDRQRRFFTLGLPSTVVTESGGGDDQPVTGGDE